VQFIPVFSKHYFGVELFGGFPHEPGVLREQFDLTLETFEIIKKLTH
jgi:hypothetical protein